MVVRATAFRRSIIAMLAGAMIAGAVPAGAQLYSEGYKFLEAIQKKDADKVLEMLSQPGSTLINSRDLTNGETGLHVVVKRRDMTWLQFLIQKGANPNISDRKGVTPLVLATQLGFNEGVDTLVKAGARVDESNEAGETPLMYAIHRRDTSLMRILLLAGADPDRTDNSGRSARDYARQSAASSVLLGEIDRSEKKAGEGTGGSYGPTF
jgi:uncharacterized protein